MRDAREMRAEYRRRRGVAGLHQPGECDCRPGQWFRCEGCGGRYGWCVGGSPDPRCDVCVVSDERAREAVARSIWPTGKPADPDDPVPFAFAYDTIRVGRTHVDAGPFSYSKRVLVCERGRIDIGIAEGRRLARARMERFVAWLRSEGLTGLAMLSSAHLSPEAATMESIEAGCRWPFKAAGIAWDEAWLREARGACDFALMGRRALASPEWAALPWQREAGR